MKLTSLFKKISGCRTVDHYHPQAWLTAEEFNTDFGRQHPLPTAPDSETAAELREAIPPVISSLEQFIEGAEADFMLLGIGLRTVHSNVTELTDLMLGTVRQMGSDEEGGFLDRGRNILNDCLAEIQAYQERVRADLGRINTVMESLEKLHDTSKQIKQFAKSLKMVALTMLVENARSIGASEDIFAEVAQEVKALSVEITAIANDVYKNVEKARAIHQATRQEISAGLNSLETLTTEIHTTVRDSTRDTETLMLFSVDIIEQAGRRSRDISRQVAEVVVGVQFHDNMKQRIMHIVGLLTAMAASATPAASSDQAPGSSDTAPAVKPFVPVIKEQAGRLNEINTEVYAVYKKNKEALQAIEQEVIELLRGLQGMTSDGRADGSRELVHDPFSHLKEALTQLHNLLDRGKTLYRGIQKAADHVSGIAVNLSELLHVVRGISAHTHNKAINSIIAAERQGTKGGALKQLAREMNDLASRSDRLSGEVEETIHTIINLTGDIGRQNMDGLSAAGDSGSSPIGRLSDVLEEISLGYDKFRRDSLTAYRRAGELKKAVDTTMASLDFFTGLSRRLDEYRDGLIDMAGRAGWEDMTVDIEQSVAGHLPGKYPCEQKDNIILFEEVRRTTRNNGAGDSFDADNGGLGDNVELF